MEAVPEENVKYVKVTKYKEERVPVYKTQIIEKPVYVPKVEYTYVDKTIEVPKLHIIDKVIEVPNIVEVEKIVPVQKIVEIPRDVITYVPKVEVKVVTREVEVPGEIIQVPVKVEQRVEKKVIKYLDQEIPTVVAQTFKPHVVESSEHVQTAKLKKYVPYLYQIPVYVPVAVERGLVAGGVQEEQRPVQMPAAQYNAQLKHLNPELSEEHLANLYNRNPDGSIPVFKGPGSAPIVVGQDGHGQLPLPGYAPEHQIHTIPSTTSTGGAEGQ